jgi:Na+:H+ antiporter, NhaA family
MDRRSHFAGRIATFLNRSLGGEAGAGILLMVAAGIALAVANSPVAEAYHDLFHHPLAWSPVTKLDTWHLWINDALMAVFFFTVGLEIKRELLIGELATAAQRRLPFLAAAAGMIVPALIYLAVIGPEPTLARGWAIASATDIAFAVGVLALLGSRVPRTLRLFLLTVAIVDDLGAVIIIALAYTAGIDLAWLGGAATVLAAMVLLNRLRVHARWPYVLLAVCLWYCVLHSGVHATVAGVLAALTVPLQLDREGESPLLRFEHALVPWSAYLVVPLFGFANAGVSLGGADAAAALPWAIALGLFFGKQGGIFAALVVARRTGFAAPPPGASWSQLWGVAVLCGIGFTMSLFIAGLAFPAAPDLVEAAKLGIVGGSVLSAVLGYAILRLSPAGG